VAVRSGRALSSGHATGRPQLHLVRGVMTGRRDGRRPPPAVRRACWWVMCLGILRNRGSGRPRPGSGLTAPQPGPRTADFQRLIDEELRARSER